MAALAAVLMLVSPLAAHAHPALDRARAAYENAEFQRALDLLVAVEAAQDLSRGDVEQLLLMRAIVHYAMDQETEWRADIVRLARLDPGFVLGPEHPPRLRAAFDEARGEALALETSAHRVPGGVLLRARVTGDPGGLVRRVEVSARRAGATEPVTTNAGTMRVPAAAGETVEHWTAVIGPGEAVLLTEGSASDPILLVDRPAAEPERAPLAPVARSEEDGGSAWVLWAGLGAVAVAAALVAVALVLSAETETQLSTPVIRAP